MTFAGQMQFVVFHVYSDQLIFIASIADILSLLLYNGEYTKKLFGNGIPVVQLAVFEPGGFVQPVLLTS
jgi:hypothetical protein